MPQLVKYLSKFRHLSSSRQAAEIIAKMGLDRENGNIRTLKDLQDSLNKLIPAGQQNLVSSLSKALGLDYGDRLDDNIINDTLLAIATDLYALFEENDNIDAILNAEQKLMFKSLSQDMKQAIKRLKAEIETHELLARLNQSNPQTYSNSRAKAWESEFQSAGRQDTRVIDLFKDPLTNESMGREQECSSLDSYLVLPVDNITIFKPKSARVVVETIDDSNGYAMKPGSAVNVDIDGLGPQNAIDGKSHTYWARSVLLPNEKLTEPSDDDDIIVGVIHTLEIEFNSLITFNYLKIEPILSSEVYIVRIKALKDGTWNTIFSATDKDDGIRLSDVRSLYFSDIQCTALRIDFESRSCKVVTFLANNTSETADFTLSHLLYTQTSDTKARELLGAVEDELEGKEFYEYFIGIDNIYVGYGSFSDKGIFISKPKTFNNINTIGIAPDWLIPYRNITSTDVEYTSDLDDTMPPSNKEILGDIELYLIKWDYADKDKKKLIRRSVFPVVPLFRGRRVYERLLLADKESSSSTDYDIGYLRFLANDTSSGLYIYQDGDLMTSGWSVSSAKSVTSINTGAPMRHAIKISNPVKESVYVAAYEVEMTNIEGKPKFNGSSWTTGSNLITYNDVLGDMTVTLDNHGFYEFDDEVNGQKIKKTEVSFMVMMRNCSKGRFSNVSPILKGCRVIVFEDVQNE